MIASQRELSKTSLPGSERDADDFTFVKKHTKEICDDNKSLDQAIQMDPGIMNMELDEEMADAIREGKDDLEILELQHEHLIQKQSNLLDLIKKNAGDLLASKLIVDELLSHKAWIEGILQKNLEDMKKFELAESLVVTTFELDQPKLKKFLEILNKMFLFEQRIKGFRDTLIELNKESQSFGEDKAKVLEAYDNKQAEFHEVLEATAAEIKQRHKSFQETKGLCESLDALMEKTRTAGQSSISPVDAIIGQAKDNKDNKGTAGTEGTEGTKSTDGEDGKKGGENKTPGTTGEVQPEVVGEAGLGDSQTIPALDESIKQALINAHAGGETNAIDAEETLRQINISCPETEKLIRWIVSIEQLSQPQRRRFLDLLNHLQEVPKWKKEPVHDYGQIWDYCVEFMLMSSDTAHLFFGTNDGHLLQWNCQTKEIEADYGVIHTHRIDGLAITPDNCYIYTSSGDGHLKVFDIYHKKLLKDFGQVSEAGFESMVAGVKGKWIYIATFDRHLLIWNWMEEKMEKDMGVIYGEGKEQDLKCLRASRDAKWLFIGTSDGHLLQWNIEKQVLEADHGAIHEDEIFDLEISQDSMWLWTVGADKRLVMWNIYEARVEHDYGVVHKNIIRCVEVSSNGSRVYTGSDDRTMKIFDTKLGSREQVHDFGQIYGKWVKQLCLDSSDQFAFTLSVDSKLKQFFVGEF